jgi:hypothetical protein
MNDEDKKQFLDEFREIDGSKKLDMWDYALEQQVLWEQILTELSTIARDQGVDKKLEKMVKEEMAKIGEK